MSEFWKDLLLAVTSGVVLLAISWIAKKMYDWISRWCYNKRHPPAVCVPLDDDLDGDRPRYF